MQTLCLRKRQKVTCTKIVHTTFTYDIWCLYKTFTFAKIDWHRVRELGPLVIDVHYCNVEGTGAAEGWLSMVHCLYGQAVAVLYFIVQGEGGHYNATMGRVDLEGEPLIASYDVVCYVSIAV